MFNYFRGFYQRHKKKIYATGLVAVGTYAFSKYAQWKYQEWEDERVKEFTKLAKKKYHFESNQKTCTVTFFSFMADTRNTIAEKLNIDSLLGVLKLQPANKLEIWEQLKVLSVCQIVCSVVCNVLLLVLLKVQLNLVGGYIFVRSTAEDRAIDKCDMNESQHEYMNNIKYFVEHMIPRIIDDTLRITQGMLCSDVSHSVFKIFFILNCSKLQYWLHFQPIISISTSIGKSCCQWHCFEGFNLIGFYLADSC